MFGNKVHYSDALSRSGLVTLQQRRTELFKNFFNKIVENLSNSVDTASEVFQRSMLFYSSNRSYRKEEWGIDFTA